jgi:hypothetical protein
MTNSPLPELSYADQISALLDAVQHLQVGIPDATQELLGLMDRAVVEALTDKADAPRIKVVH